MWTIDISALEMLRKWEQTAEERSFRDVRAPDAGPAIGASRPRLTRRKAS